MTLVGGSRHIDGRGGWTPTQPTCSNLLSHPQTAQQKVKGLQNFFCFWEIFEEYALKKFFQPRVILASLVLYICFLSLSSMQVSLKVIYMKVRMITMIH